MLNWFLSRFSNASDIVKDCPSIKGHVTLNLTKDGKIVRQVEGYNIWTLTGREFLAELIGIHTYSNTPADRVFFRNDRVSYIGMGSGSQEEVSNITKLVNPVAFTGGTNGTFLAQLDQPTFPASSLGTPKT